MRRDGKVCWTGFALTSITVAFVVTATVLFTVFPKDYDSSVFAFNPRTGDFTEPDEKVDRFDHRSHSVPGGIYEETDFAGKGKLDIQLDGSRSHTHYVDEGPPLVIGRIVTYVWFANATHEVVATGVKPKIELPVGTHVLGLTVADNTRDTQTDFTRVIIKGPITPGVYCYYYTAAAAAPAIPDDITQGPRPMFAAGTTGIDFKKAANFPKEINADPFSARCVFRTFVRSGDKFTFAHGGPVKLILGGNVLTPSGSTGATTTFQYNGVPSTVRAQVIYTHSRGAAKLELSGSGRKLEYDVSKTLPVIFEIDPKDSTLEGGGKATITGVALGNSVKVFFNGVEAVYDQSTVSRKGDSLTVTVPPSKQGGVNVVVRNTNGESNPLSFNYAIDGKPPIKFEETTITKDGSPYLINQITGLKYGPDHRYYVTSYASRVHSFTVNEKLQVGAVCVSPPLGAYRVPLGLAFNYASSRVRVYVSTSVLYWKSKGYSDTWANGQVHMLEANVGGKCLNEIKGSPIITGLPVSNYDHGVNGMVFDDDGNLHIQVGGSTNAGFKNKNLGGQDESPLSGASLIAELTKQPFDGKVRYSSQDPGTAKQTGGFGVKIFSSGWRNSFGINIHSNGILYATDNGASQSFGDMSASCTRNTKLPGTAYLYDKLGKVVKNKYFGHPNRNRGRSDSKQCIFQNHDAQAAPHYQPPVMVLESSTNGVLEYTANTFDGQLKGNLILSKFASGESPGTIFRVRLEPDGNARGKADVLWGASGLSLEMSPYGELISPQVRPTAEMKHKIIVLRPITAKTNKQTFRAVMPNRGSYKGGNIVMVTGLNIGLNPYATFNGVKCTNVKDVTTTSFKCTVPQGKRGQKVEVAIVSSKGPTPSTKVKNGVGADYKYMNI